MKKVRDQQELIIGQLRKKIAELEGKQEPEPLLAQALALSLALAEEQEQPLPPAPMVSVFQKVQPVSLQVE